MSRAPLLVLLLALCACPILRDAGTLTKDAVDCLVRAHDAHMTPGEAAESCLKSDAPDIIQFVVDVFAQREAAQRAGVVWHGLPVTDAGADAYDGKDDWGNP